ncbi:MAG: YHS domain-containing (seleno)protein [Burkholderiales bacterium]
MNIKAYLLVLAGLVFAATGHAQELKAKHNVDDSKIALHGYSPVSYVDLNLAQRGVKGLKSTHDGETYYFVTPEQKAAFDKNPTKYLPQYGGFCAFGVSVGAKFRVDPNKFVVSNGKVFLFLNDVEVDAKQLWVQGKEQELIAKANANWEKLGKQL